MKPTLFKGSGVALITPYDKDNRINLQKIKELIELHIKAGTKAIILCGTTGESPALTFDEKIKIFEESVKVSSGRVPIIAGTGSNNTASAVKLSIEAQKCGVNGLLCVTPYYNKTSQKGLLGHFFEIADNVDIPIILYNVPSRTGMDINIETYKKLSEHQNIIAVKEACGNIEKILEIRNSCNDDLSIYSGNDEILVPSLSAGCIGIISVAANIIPSTINSICETYKDGKAKICTEEQLYWFELFKSMFCEVNPIPIKEAMNYLGYNVGNCRKPLCNMEKEKYFKLIETINKYPILK